MSYEPTSWSTGDVVTAAKLNKLENGVANAGGVFVVGMTYDYDNDRITLNKTYSEILSAVQAGSVIVAKGADTSNDYDLNEGFMSLGVEDGVYFATAYLGMDIFPFTADSTTGVMICDLSDGGDGGSSPVIL